MPTATLLTIPFSHYCEKARWALDRARVPYVEKGHMPGFHRLAVRRTGSNRTSVPVLVVDGKTFGDSTDILAYADRTASPERKLYPQDPRVAAEVCAIEEDLDETLGPHLRRAFYFHLLPERRLVLELFSTRTPLWQGAALRIVYPRLRQVMESFMQIDPQSAAQSFDEVQRIFDGIEKRLADGRPYLTGDRFTAADLTLAALTAPAVRPDEHPAYMLAIESLPPALAAATREYGQRPIGAFVRRMYAEQRAAN
jgi:glutathione S-transferase